MAGKQTPLMRQYWGIKNQHLDKILLFRMGDFFEIFHEDAEVAAPILNIALTQRNKKFSDSTKMCGMPHHSIGAPIGKLLAAGHRVAICDQVEDPQTGSGDCKKSCDPHFKSRHGLRPRDTRPSPGQTTFAVLTRSLSAFWRLQRVRPFTTRSLSLPEGGFDTGFWRV